MSTPVIELSDIQKRFGNTATATVDGMTDAEIQKLRADLSATIAVEQLNLEEIFMETHR